MYKNPIRAIDRARENHKSMPYAEKYLLELASKDIKNARYLYEYAIQVLPVYHRHQKALRWLEAEPYIIENPQVAADYARWVIGGRWPEAESSIASHVDAVWAYVAHTCKCRVPEFEPMILTSAFHIHMYASRILKSPWPEGERALIEMYKDKFKHNHQISAVNHLSQMVEYADDVKNGRWEEAEKYILNSPAKAAEYAIRVIKSRWPIAEPIIMRDPSAAAEYAAEVLKDRWLEAEPIILKTASSAYEYAKLVIKGRWPQAEQIILSAPYYALNYSAIAFNGRWLEAEPSIFSSETYAQVYFGTILKDPVNYMEALRDYLSLPNMKPDYKRLLKRYIHSYNQRGLGKIYNQNGTYKFKLPVFPTWHGQASPHSDNRFIMRSTKG